MLYLEQRREALHGGALLRKGYEADKGSIVSLEEQELLELALKTLSSVNRTRSRLSTIMPTPPYDEATYVKYFLIGFTKNRYPKLVFMATVQQILTWAIEQIREQEKEGKNKLLQS